MSIQIVSDIRGTTEEPFPQIPKHADILALVGMLKYYAIIMLKN